MTKLNVNNMWGVIFFYLIYWFVFVIAKSGGMSYWIVRDSIPLMLFSLSNILTVKVKIKRFFFVSSLIAMGAIIINAVVIPQHRYPLYFLGLKWQYYVLIEYLFFGMLAFKLLLPKMKPRLKTFAFTLLLLPTSGFLYEIPFFIDNSNLFISEMYPFFVRMGVVYLAVCFYELRTAFRNPLVLLALIGTGLFSVYYYGFNLNVPAWLVRIPSICFWLITIYYWRVKNG